MEMLSLSATRGQSGAWRKGGILALRNCVPRERQLAMRDKKDHGGWAPSFPRWPGQPGALNSQVDRQEEAKGFPFPFYHWASSTQLKDASTWGQTAVLRPHAGRTGPEPPVRLPR